MRKWMRMVAYLFVPAAAFINIHPIVVFLFPALHNQTLLYPMALDDSLPHIKIKCEDSLVLRRLLPLLQRLLLSSAQSGQTSTIETETNSTLFNQKAYVKHIFHRLPKAFGIDAEVEKGYLAIICEAVLSHQILGLFISHIFVHTICSVDSFLSRILYSIE